MAKQVSRVFGWLRKSGRALRGSLRGIHSQSWPQQTELACERLASGEEFPHRYGKVDRHLIQTKGMSKPLPSDYVEAINRALGITGVLKPLDNRQQLPVARELPLTVTPKQLPACITSQSSNGNGHDDEFDLENLP